ncbi:SDR family oxidoreductase [Luedemannella flava]|uniref:SDR family oxidoreductase n=1 Tax=Luedemannella flava TaxID=349316 RepID=A0ABN2LKZ3_9ACTN
MPKSVLITGASRGIGMRTAEKFLRSDDGVTDVVLVARESADFTRTVESLRADNPLNKRIHTFEVDLGDRALAVGMVKDVLHHVGRVDILINNAGFTAPMSIQQIAFSDFETTIAVNLYAPFTIVQELLRGGNTFQTVINVASTAGINGRSGWLTYSSSKAALIAMSEVMREELAIFGTRVICISPGRCATDLRKTLAPDEDPTTIMQPEHVAEVMHMLASDVGRYIDSQNLVVRL